MQSERNAPKPRIHAVNERCEDMSRKTATRPQGRKRQKLKDLKRQKIFGEEQIGGASVSFPLLSTLLALARHASILENAICGAVMRLSGLIELEKAICENIGYSRLRHLRVIRSCFFWGMND
jgi:hypothetical protein